MLFKGILLLIVATSTFALEFKAYVSNSTLYVGEISEALVISSTRKEPKEQRAVIKDDIQRQLRFLLGHLSRHESTADTAGLEFSIIDIKPGVTPGTVEVRYSATLNIALSNQYFSSDLANNKEFLSVVPLRPGKFDLKEFTKKYAKKCSELGKNTQPQTFYYYYNPLKRSCPFLRDNFSSIDTSADTTKISIELTPSPFNKNQLNPKVQEAWEDNVLKVVAVYSLDKDELPVKKAAGDWGTKTYKLGIKKVMEVLGKPIFSSIGKKRPNQKRPYIKYEFNSPRGKVETHFFLVERFELENPNAEFKRLFSQHSKDADIVSYAGHAGYGENVENIVKNAVFQEEQFQTWLILGCNTYSYLGNSLAQASGKANGIGPSYNYVDVILTAYLYYFGEELSTPLPKLISNFIEDNPKNWDKVLDSVAVGHPIVITE